MADLNDADPTITWIIANSGQTATAPDSYIMRAWEAVYDWLRRKGTRPHQMVEPEQLREVTRAKALELLCRANSQQPNDKFWQLADRFEADYELAQSEVYIELSEKGPLYAASERKRALTQPEIGTGPDYDALADPFGGAIGVLRSVQKVRL